MASEFSSSLWLENLSSSFGESLENVDDLFQSPEAILADVVSGVLRGNISTNDFISALKSFREDLKSDLLDSVLSVLWIEGNQVVFCFIVVTYSYSLLNNNRLPQIQMLRNSNCTKV